MNAKQFLAAFPTTERDVCTGGNCTAWLVPLWGGGHVLITTPEGAYQPDMRTRRVIVGTYEEDGSYDESYENPEMTWLEAAAYVRVAIESRKGLVP